MRYSRRVMSFRDSASFGKRQEYIAVAEMLKLGYDVYMTLVDDQQIDCVIRIEDGAGAPRYVDVQIKARSGRCKPTNAGTFAAMEVRRPRENFVFVFYSEQADCYWVVPSLDLVKEARQNKSGKNKGCYTVVFTNHSKRSGKVVPRPRFERYRGEWKLLGEPPPVDQA